MQRANDGQELEGQAPQKKYRLAAYSDRIADAVQAALFNAQAEAPVLTSQPLVLWCTDEDDEFQPQSLLYWPCNQLAGEQLIRALYSSGGDRSRLVRALMDMARGYLSDYKAAKHPPRAATKQWLVQRFLKPGQPLAALGVLCVLLPESVDIRPLARSKHAMDPISESRLDPHLFYVHCNYNGDGADDDDDTTTD